MIYWFVILGGTVDVTVHEIDGSGDIKELYQASGGAWGGTKVDMAFEKFIGEIFGEECSCKILFKYLLSFTYFFHWFK